VRRVALRLTGRTTPLLKPFAVIRRVIALRRVLRESRAASLIAFMPHEAVMAIIAGTGMPCRVIASERSTPWRRDPGQPWGYLRRWLYRHADAHAAQTEATAQWLRDNCGATNVHVIPNPVRHPIPSVEPSLAPSEFLPEGRSLLLAMGGRPYLKGYDLLAEAFFRIAQRHTDWDLAIPGLPPEPSDEDAAERRMRAIFVRPELAGRIHLPGRVGNPGEWHAAADIFVLSSRTEGFPNVLIEAMAHGSAVIAFDCETGPRDIILDGENGRLVANIDVDALATALDELMSDTPLRDRLSAEAVAVRHRFDQARVLNAWLELLP